MYFGWRMSRSITQNANNKTENETHFYRLLQFDSIMGFGWILKRLLFICRLTQNLRHVFCWLWIFYVFDLVLQIFAFLVTIIFFLYFSKHTNSPRNDTNFTKLPVIEKCARQQENLLSGLDSKNDQICYKNPNSCNFCDLDHHQVEPVDNYMVGFLQLHGRAKFKNVLFRLTNKTSIWRWYK